MAGHLHTGVPRIINPMRAGAVQHWRIVSSTVLSPEESLSKHLPNSTCTKVGLKLTICKILSGFSFGAQHGSGG